MPDGQVIVTLSVQDAEALRAWQRSKKGISEMQAEMKGTKRAAAESASSAQQFGNSLARAAVRAATGLASVTAAIALVKREFAEMRERGEGAAGQQIQVARAQRAALRNLSYTELTPEQLQVRAAGINARTGANLEDVYDASADALSARGTLSEKEAMTQVEATAKLDPSFAREEMKLVTGAALDIRKAFGGGAEQALGAILAAQQTARVTSTQEFAHNAVPAIVSLKERGDTFREINALYSTISQASADETGARSGTALVQFARQIVTATASVEEFRGKTVSVTKRLEFLKSGTAEAEAQRRKLVGNLNQHHDDLQAAQEEEDDPTAKAKLTAEAKQYFTLIDLLNKGSAVDKAYHQTLQATPEYEQAGERFKQTLEAQARLSGQATAKLDEVGRGALQSVKQSQEEEALTEKTRTDLTAFLKQIGDYGAGPMGSQVSRELETGEHFGWTGLSGMLDGWTRQEGSPMRRGIEILRERQRAAKESGQDTLPENAATKAAIENYIKGLEENEAMPANRHLFKQRLAPRDAALAATPASELRPPAPAGMEYDSAGRLRAKRVSSPAGPGGMRGRSATPTGPRPPQVTQAQVDAANARLDEWSAEQAKKRKPAPPPQTTAARKQTAEPAATSPETPAPPKKPAPEVAVTKSPKVGPVFRPPLPDAAAAKKAPTDSPRTGINTPATAATKLAETTSPRRQPGDRRQESDTDGQKAKPALETILSEQDRRRQTEADAALKKADEANELLRTIADRLIPKPTTTQRPPLGAPQRPPVQIGG